MSLSSVFVDFIARTAGFQADVQKAAAVVQQSGNEMAKANVAVGEANSKMTNAIEKGALRIGASFLGARSVMMAVANEVRDVYKNIDNIPGVPQDTIDSIERMKYSLEGANGVLKPAIATMMGWFQNLGEGIGYAAGAALYGIDATTDAFQKMNDEAAQFASREFDKKFEALQKQFDNLKLSSGELAAELLSDAAALESKTGVTQKETWDSSLEAAKNRIEAQKILNRELSEYDKLIDLDKSQEEKMKLAFMSTGAAVEYLRDKRNGLIESLQKIQGENFDTFIGDPVALEKYNESMKKLIVTQKEYGVALVKLKEPVTMLRDTFIHNFENMGDAISKMVVEGKWQFRDLFKTILEQMVAMMAKLAIINPIINTVFGLTGTSAALAVFGGFFAKGGRPDPGKVSVVGEDGPELFVPDSAGAVIPNSAFGGGRGGDSGPNIVINQTFSSGLTRQDFMTSLPMIISHTKSAVADAVQRGGGYRKAFA